MHSTVTILLENSLLSKQPRYYLCKFLILAVQPFSLVAVGRLLTAVASLVTEHRLYAVWAVVVASTGI